MYKTDILKYDYSKLETKRDIVAEFKNFNNPFLYKTPEELCIAMLDSEYQKLQEKKKQLYK